MYKRVDLQKYRGSAEKFENRLLGPTNHSIGLIAPVFFGAHPTQVLNEAQQCRPVGVDLLDTAVVTCCVHRMAWFRLALFNGVTRNLIEPPRFMIPYGPRPYLSQAASTLPSRVDSGQAGRLQGHSTMGRRRIYAKPRSHCTKSRRPIVCAPRNVRSGVVSHIKEAFQNMRRSHSSIALGSRRCLAVHGCCF